MESYMFTLDNITLLLKVTLFNDTVILYKH